MFLTRDELKALTGYTRAADQIKWLRNNKVAFVVNAAGIPIVSRTAIETMLGAGGSSSQAEPNWGALRA
jgi:Domain of unknown function (DUF4224)